MNTFQKSQAAKLLACYTTPEELENEIEKAHPIGYINKDGYQKQADGKYKYVGKPGASKQSKQEGSNAPKGKQAAASHKFENLSEKDASKLSKLIENYQSSDDESTYDELYNYLEEMTGSNYAEHFIDTQLPESTSMKDALDAIDASFNDVEETFERKRKTDLSSDQQNKFKDLLEDYQADPQNEDKVDALHKFVEGISNKEFADKFMEEDLGDKVGDDPEEGISILNKELAKN